MQVIVADGATVAGATGWQVSAGAGPAGSATAADTATPVRVTVPVLVATAE